MNSIRTMFLAALVLVGVGCGYTSHPTTPPAAGTTPNISQLAPNTVTAGTSGVVLTVNGTNFNANATINWNGTALPKTTFVSGNQLMTTIPDSNIAAAGTATVTVTNPGISGGTYGGGTSPETSNSMTFTVNQ